MKGHMSTINSNFQWHKRQTGARRPTNGNRLTATPLYGDHRDVVLVGKRDHVVAIDDDGLAGFDGQDFCAGGNERLNGAEANGGDVKTHVLLRLGDFHDGETALRAE